MCTCHLIAVIISIAFFCLIVIWIMGILVGVSYFHILKPTLSKTHYQHPPAAAIKPVVVTSVYDEFKKTHLYFEFTNEHFPKGELTETQRAEIVLFAISNLPKQQIANMNQVTKNIWDWYNTFIEPMFKLQNIEYSLRRIQENSEFFIFHAHYKPEFITSLCEFR